MHYNLSLLFFFFNDTATTEIYTLSLHDALPIFLKAHHAKPQPDRTRRNRQSAWRRDVRSTAPAACRWTGATPADHLRDQHPACRARAHHIRAADVWPRAPPLLRSEEHTSELQSPCNLECRL